MVVTMKNTIDWMLCRVARARTDVSEELSASIIRVTRIGELGTMSAVTSNRCILHQNKQLSDKSMQQRMIKCNIIFHHG
jgi:hypothetical protein